jgi:RNA polymerase sigma-70 factor (ECF subfamily)
MLRITNSFLIGSNELAHYLTIVEGCLMEADVAFLDAVRRMDQDALTKVFDDYAAVLFRYAMHKCGDPLTADNIVGDVFARLLDQLSSGNGPSFNLHSYLFEMAYHMLVDEARHSDRRMPLEELDLKLSEENVIYTKFENHLLCEAISQVIQSELTEYQQQVILLRFLEGFSLRETATILGKSVNIIKAVQNRAIVNMRNCLQKWAVT